MDGGEGTLLGGNFTQQWETNDLGNLFTHEQMENGFLFFLRARLPKSPEQANTPTSQAGGIETQSQGDPCRYKSGVCILL